MVNVKLSMMCMMYLILLVFEDGVILLMIVHVIAFLCVNGALQ